VSIGGYILFLIYAEGAEIADFQALGDAAAGFLLLSCLTVASAGFFRA